MRSISTMWKPLLTLAIMSILPACSQTLATATTGKAECALFPPITYSAKGDTAETVRQVRAYNAGRDKYCGR